MESVYEDLKILINKFPQNLFVFYDRSENEDFSVFDAKLVMECRKAGITNIIGGLYIARDMVENFIGLIPDLEKDILENYHLEHINENGHNGIKAVHN